AQAPNGNVSKSFSVSRSHRIAPGEPTDCTQARARLEVDLLCLRDGRLHLARCLNFNWGIKDYCSFNSFCTSRNSVRSRTCESGIGLSVRTVALRDSMANSNVLSVVPPS